VTSAGSLLHHCGVVAAPRVKRPRATEKRDRHPAFQSRAPWTRIRGRDRNGNCLGQRVRNVVQPEQAKSDHTLRPGHCLGRLAARWASGKVRRGSGGETQPAVRTANVGHSRSFPMNSFAFRASPGCHHHRFFPGRSRPHSGQTRFITGSSSPVLPGSKYTRWRPPPNTRRTCPHSQRCSAFRSELRETRGSSVDAISVALATGSPPRC